MEGHFAGITCNGDATIIIEGNNEVVGCDNLPAIIVPDDNAYNAKTLTLKGSGFLKASADLDLDDPFNTDESAAGIGGDELGEGGGNIVIEGTLTVEAYGGDSCPGIGSAGYCGYITIGKDVKLKAVKGDGAEYCIGAGAGPDNCGKITIGGVVYFDGTQFTSDELKNALAASSFLYNYSGN